MSKIFPNLIKTINQKFQEAQQAPSTCTVRTNTPRHITIKLLRTSCEKKILKADKILLLLCMRKQDCGSRFVIRDNANYKTVKQRLKNSGKKILYTWNSVPWENIFQK